MADLSSFSFRPAGLGGFNKKDVIAYIRILSERHAAEVKSLERALSESEKQKGTLSVSLAAAEKALSASGGVEEMKIRLTAAEKDHAVFRDKLHAVEKALADAETRAAALEEENARLKEEKAAADDILEKLEKEKRAVTELELEARIRARETEEAARSRIASIITTFQTEFSEAKESFRHYKSSADRLIASTEDQLRDMLTMFRELENELELSEKAFEKLSSDPVVK